MVSLLLVMEEVKGGFMYRERNVVEHDVEPCCSFGEVVTHEPGDILPLRDQLAGVELGHDALEHFVHNRGKHSFIVIGTQGAVDLRESVHTWTGEHPAGDVDHLQVLGAG